MKPADRLTEVFRGLSPEDAKALAFQFVGSMKAHANANPAVGEAILGFLSATANFNDDTPALKAAAKRALEA